MFKQKNKEPIEDVKVQFIFDGAPEPRLTNSDGYVRLKIPERDDVEVILTKDGFRTLSRILNLSADENRTRVFVLEQEISSSGILIDVQQYTAQHTFFPLVLSLIKPNLSIPVVKRIFLEFLDIDSQPLIEKNEVFDNIEKFRIESGNDESIYATLEDQILMTRRTETSSNFTSYLIDPRHSLEIAEIGNNPYDLLESSIFGSENECYAGISNPIQITSEEIEYTSFLDQNYILQIPKLSSLQKYGSEDIFCQDSLKDFWIKKVIENNPNNRGFFAFLYSYILDLDDFSYQVGQCEEGLASIIADSSWSLNRYIPSPYIKFVDIRNNTQETINIQSINYQIIKKKSYSLTTADKRKFLFQESPTQKKTKTMNISLRKNQHFLIPIEFGFNTESQKKAIAITYWSKKGNIAPEIETLYISRPLNHVDKEKFNQGKLKEIIPMSKTNLPRKLVEDSPSLEKLLDLIPQRFAIGSILNIESIKVNNRDIIISPPNDEPTVYVSPYLQAGSCPYLIIYNRRNWREIGTILTNINNKSLQHDEVYELDNNISKIKIEEREPEITYFDSLSILYTDPDTTEEKVTQYPLPELETVDNEYFLLHQGESFEIDLNNLIPTNAINVKLKVNGYYKRTSLIN